MKKIATLSLILILISAVAPAQRQLTGVRVRTQSINTVSITRPERSQLRRDMIRLKIIQRNARRDGIVTPLEKRRIHKAKCKTHRDAFRFRHNGRNRLS
jgi:hypothetical protein